MVLVLLSLAFIELFVSGSGVGVFLFLIKSGLVKVKNL